MSGGDIVKIKHTEIGGHLCVDGSNDDSNFITCFVRKYRGTNPIEESDSNCLFELEINCKDENGRFLRWKDTKERKPAADLLNITTPNGETEEGILFLKFLLTF